MALSDADKKMNRVISSFLIIFLSISLAGLIIIGLVGLNNASYLFTVPELLLGFFLFALMTVLSIGIFFHHVN